jgi:hypothetical protein
MMMVPAMRPVVAAVIVPVPEELPQETLVMVTVVSRRVPDCCAITTSVHVPAVIVSTVDKRLAHRPCLPDY